MRTFLSTTLISVLLLPAQALAALATPGDVFKAMEAAKEQPQSFSAELHATAEDVYIAAWLKGQSQGNTAETLAGTFTLTVDVADDKGMWMRFRGEVRMKGNMAYFRVSGTEGKLEDEVISLMGKLDFKKWISMPLPEEVFAMNEGSMDAMLQEMVNQYLWVEHSETANGRVYSLKLTPQAMAMAQDSLGVDASVMDSFIFHIKVTMDKNDAFRAMKAYISAKNMDFSGVLQATSSVLNTAVRVDVPTNVITAEAFTRHFEKWDTLDFPSFNPLPSNDWPVTDDMDWEAPTDTDDWVPPADGDWELPPHGGDDMCDPGTSQGLQNMRKGLCGTESAPRRSSVRNR